VDSHAHIFDPNRPMAEGRRYTPDYAATLEDWFAHLDAAGLSHGVLIQPSFLGQDNGMIAEALSVHPDRLRGVAVLANDTSEAELARLDAAGFVGARLNLVGRTPEDYAAPDWQRFFHRLAEIGWQIEIQRPVTDIAAITPPILATGLTVMIDHFGLPEGGLRPDGPGHQAFLDLLSREPGLWVKLSA
ncbi:amidohydrolase, partial [Thioclava sp. BHET1]